LLQRGIKNCTGFILVIDNYPDTLSVPALKDYGYVKIRYGTENLCNTYWNPESATPILFAHPW